MSSAIYQKNAVIMPELAITTITNPSDFLLIEGVSATEKISVGDFVNSYSTVYYQFALSGGDLLQKTFSSGIPLSANDLGRVVYAWKGAYSPSFNYTNYDVVYYNGSSFISLTANNAVTPVSGTGQWDLLALGYTSGTVLITVQNITALRALDSITSPQLVTNGTVAEVLGYYNANDRGGGPFTWNSTSTLPDDGGSVIKPTAISGAGRWIRNLAGERPNVKMWGAKGDFLTDDTNAITYALSAMCYGWATELVFTTGSYLISNTLQVPSNIKIIGEGIANNTSIGMIQFSNKDIITTVAPTTAAPFNYIPIDSGFIIENLTLFFQNYNNPSFANTINSCLIIHNPSDGAIIRNIATYGGANGITCIGTTAGVQIEDVSTNYAYNAGLNIQPLSTYEIGSVNVDGLYCFNGDVSTYGSAIVLNNEASNISLKSLFLSGSFGSGAILWTIPQLSSLSTAPYLKINDSTFNGDNVYTTDFLVLSSVQNTTKIPTICFEGVTLTNCNNVITDTITNYNIPSQTLSAIQTLTPFYYTVNNINALSGQDRLISVKKIDTSSSQFIPPVSGWYSVYTAQSGQAIANLNIGSIYESTNFDVQFNNINGGYIKVNRFDTLSACATRARVISYNNVAYVDIYVNTAGVPLTITYKNEGRENYKTDSLCIPTITNTVPDQNYYTKYEEVTFNKGIVASTMSLANGHIKLGSNHFWIENGKDYRHYNEGGEIIIVDSVGTGAVAKAYIQNGQVVRADVINGGSGYASPNAYVASYDGGGTGAVLSVQISSGVITKISVTNSGSGYGTTPITGSGRKFLTDTDVYTNSIGTAIRNARRVNYESVNLTIASGSKVATGSGLLSSIYAGDKVMSPDQTKVIEFQQIVNDTTAILTSAYPVAATNAKFTKIGWELFPALSGFKYVITGIKIWIQSFVSNPIWSAATPNQLMMAIRTKNQSTPNYLGYFNYNNWDNSSGDDLRDPIFYENYMVRYTYIQPTDYSFTISPVGTTILTNGIGIGATLPNNVGITIDLINTLTLNYYMPTKGSPCIVEVWGMKYPANSTY